MRTKVTKVTPVKTTYTYEVYKGRTPGVDRPCVTGTSVHCLVRSDNFRRSQKSGARFVRSVSKGMRGLKSRWRSRGASRGNALIDQSILRDYRSCKVPSEMPPEALCLSVYADRSLSICGFASRLIGRTANKTIYELLVQQKVHAGQVVRDGRPFSSVMMGGCFPLARRLRRRRSQWKGALRQAPFSVAFIAKTF